VAEPKLKKKTLQVLLATLEPETFEEPKVGTDHYATATS